VAGSLERWRQRWAIDRDRLALAGRRSQEVLLLAGVTGVLVGLAVAAFDELAAEHVFPWVLDLPLWATAAAPLVGLLLSAAALRWLAGGATPATTDEYIRSFHEQGRALDTRPAPGRLAASIATLGSGGSLGYEGPAIYAGSSIGAWLQQRLARVFRTEDPKVLLVAGAAAGVAAIFRAPVTGLVYALEVPYRDDLARRALLPAAVASAASYVTFAALIGTDPLFPVAGQPDLSLRDLLGAALVGLFAGGFARLFSVVIGRAKALQGLASPWVRALVAGVVLGGLFLAGWAMTDANLTLGAGYDTMRWATSADHGLLLIVAAATLRVAATATTVAGGGVGGLFVPLVVQGYLVGEAARVLVDPANATLFPVVGIAAYLGAGYNVALASVVFVAEVTGRPGFVVPGLIAAVVAQLVMGRRSLSPYQVDRRTGYLERRLAMGVAATVDTEARTVPPDATLDELFWQHLIGTRQRAAVVVDGNRYLGLVGVDELGAVEQEAWPQRTVAEVMRTDVPTISPSATVSDAAQAMAAHRVDRLAVTDGDAFVGVVTHEGIVRLDEILDATDR